MLKNKMDDSEIYCKLGEILYDDRFAFDRFRSAAYNEVNEILNQIKKSDIVFLGDSVLNFTDPKESVQTSVPREALQKYPEQSFAQKFGLCNR